MCCLCCCYYYYYRKRRNDCQGIDLSYASSGRDNFADQKFKVIAPVQFEPRGEETTAGGVGSGNDGGGRSNHSSIWKKIASKIVCASAATQLYNDFFTIKVNENGCYYLQLLIYVFIFLCVQFK